MAWPKKRGNHTQLTKVVQTQKEDEAQDLRTSGRQDPQAQMSRNQNLVLKWSTQNHVQDLEGGRSYLWLGLALTNLHLPRF